MNETHAVGRPCTVFGRHKLALQIRAGDIFSGHYTKAGSWQPAEGIRRTYVQPALQHYLECMDQFTTSDEATIALCEDYTNPVCLALRTIASLRRVNLTVVSWPLGETMATLGCTPYVCAARSTMSRVYANRFHTKKIISAPPAKNSSIYPWENTALQRMMMVGEPPHGPARNHIFG